MNKYELIPVVEYENDNLKRVLGFGYEGSSFESYVKKNFYRVRALKDFGAVRKGTVGGIVEHEENLSQEGDCWIYNNAAVIHEAGVYDNASVFNDSVVLESSVLYGNAEIYNMSIIRGHAELSDNAKVYDDVVLDGNIALYGDVEIKSSCQDAGASVCGTA